LSWVVVVAGTGATVGVGGGGGGVSEGRGVAEGGSVAVMSVVGTAVGSSVCRVTRQPLMSTQTARSVRMDFVGTG
jgi:hypothetical protein